MTAKCQYKHRVINMEQQMDVSWTNRHLHWKKCQ